MFHSLHPRARFGSLDRRLPWHWRLGRRKWRWCLCAWVQAVECCEDFWKELLGRNRFWEESLSSPLPRARPSPKTRRMKTELLSTHPWLKQLQQRLGRLSTARAIKLYIWVVVKIMVPFWIPILIRHLIFRVP